MDAIIIIVIGAALFIAFKMGLLWCLKWYLVYRLARFLFDIWQNVRRIKRENAAIMAADEKVEKAHAAGDDEALTVAIFEWHDAIGRTAAVMEINERRIQCSNFGCHARPQEQPWPGVLEDVAAFFRLLGAAYQDLVLRTIRKLRLAKPMKPRWA